MSRPLDEPRDLAVLCAEAREAISKLTLRYYNPAEASRRLGLLADEIERLPGRPVGANDLVARLRGVAQHLDVADQLAEITGMCVSLEG